MALGIAQAEHHRRRQAVLAAMDREALLILPAARETTRNRDVHHPFRQDSDFAWLTGFPEPEAVAVLAPGHRAGAYQLFCRARDPEREVWEGTRAGVEGACARYRARAAHPLAELDTKLPELLTGRRRLFYPFGIDDANDLRVMRWLRAARAKARSGKLAPSELLTSDLLLHPLRQRKSQAELTIMRRAARISANAHRELMRHCRPGLNEQSLEACFLRHCTEQGARFQAYPPIVGGGTNACVLHYAENTAPLRAGDLVLVDAGCEYLGYAADITRTFPVSGRFSAPQRELYGLVLAAQQAALDQARPGCAWDAPHRAAVRTITRGLLALGLLEGSARNLPRLIKEEQYKPFFMHRTGHWLGMDVHDVGDYRANGQWVALEPGMTLTVEPGLYIAPDAEVPARYRGIGIRIEDDVLITEDGHEVLSADAPKAIADIEALMHRLPAGADSHEDH